MSTKNSKNFDRYMNTYSGQHLKWPLSTDGVWQVFGEDPNCDLGGSHHNPELGIYEGKLGDVIRMAVELPGFWQWGAGGDFRLVHIKSVADMARTLQLNAELKALKERVAEIEKELKS
jgi:hypothetical protein